MCEKQEKHRMTNKEWIDFLVEQFDVSRTSAKEMLHGLMKYKKIDNIKKIGNTKMNHDSAHCKDFQPDCPQDCFRAQLVRDLQESNYPYPTAWMKFAGTEECKRKPNDDL